MSTLDVDDLLARVATLEGVVARMEELETIRHLRERYCLYVDAKRWEDLGAILTPDYQHFSSNTAFAEPVLVAEGAEAFLERLAALTNGATTVHVCSMPTVKITGPGAATGLWSMTDVVSHPEEVGMRFSGRGHYQDAYRRGNDGVWRIAVTRLTRQRLDPLPLREPQSAPSLPSVRATT